MQDIPHKEYFEGTMQLRGCDKDVYDWVKSTVEKDQKALITKEKKVKGGIDLYFSSQRYLRAIGKKINKKFTGEYKQTRTLHTKSRTGKELYRVTILFRQLPLSKNCKIEFQGEKFEVLNIGNQVQVRSLESGKKKQIRIDQLKKSKPL